MNHDLAIIGGGIIGIATALEVTRQYPGMSVVLVEKEDAVACHQSGRNSGVIHAGVYYQPGSLKARFCRDGVAATIAFCKAYGVPFEQCGKLLVATDAVERERMKALHERCIQNGITVETLDAAELTRREPHISGVGALFVPTTGIVDYGVVTRRMAEILRERGVEILLGKTVNAIEETPSGVTLHVGDLVIRATHLVACAGIMADRIVRLAGLDLDFQMVPFRGEYYRLNDRLSNIVSHLIYPIPDPALPFLGVHLTRTIDREVTVGPNAVLAFARNGYRFGDVNAGDLAEMVRFPGFRKVIAKNLRSGLDEMWKSLSKRRYLALCRRYCPELEVADLEPYRAGIRAQAVMRDGTLVHDFLIRETRRGIHVCNAPSPAATSAMPIAADIVRRAMAVFAWPAPSPRERGFVDAL